MHFPYDFARDPLDFRSVACILGAKVLAMPMYAEAKIRLFNYLCDTMAKKPFTPIPPMAELPPAEEINVAEILDRYLSGEIDLICVLGPTASGKTKYAVRLAREINSLLSARRPQKMSTGGKGEESVLPPWPQGEGFFLHPCLPCSGAEIISADSRQVYRGMDIGTGKDLNEYEEIPYHLMDIVDAGAKYNIFEYQRDFEKAYKDIVERGGIPILCGGSGLYIEAATCGYSLPEVPADPALREELEKKSTEELIRQLESLLDSVLPGMKLYFGVGVYMIQPGERDVEQLYNNAMIACEMLGEDAENKIAFFDVEMNNQKLWERKVEDDMDRALENREFQVYLQPKISTTDEQLGGAEALVRWIHPRYGFMSPGEFIPIFEDNGFVAHVDR